MKTLISLLIAFTTVNLFAQTTSGYQADKISAALSSFKIRVFLSGGEELKKLKSIRTINHNGRADLDNFILGYETHNEECDVVINVTRRTTTEEYSILMEKPTCRIK